MRLFTAILFNEEIKASLETQIDKLKKLSKSGSFTQRENLHLTVNFIGETDRLNEVKAAMRRGVEQSHVSRFTLTIGDLGKFSRREGDIYWIGVEEEKILTRLQRELVKELKEEGFYEIDDHEYRPHLTLGRRVLPGREFDAKSFASQIPLMQTEATKISLMKSERIQGKLTYTEIFYIELK